MSELTILMTMLYFSNYNSHMLLDFIESRKSLYGLECLGSGIIRSWPLRANLEVRIQHFLCKNNVN